MKLEKNIYRIIVWIWILKTRKKKSQNIKKVFICKLKKKKKKSNRRKQYKKTAGLRIWQNGSFYTAGHNASSVLRAFFSITLLKHANITYDKQLSNDLELWKRQRYRHRQGMQTTQNTLQWKAKSCKRVLKLDDAGNQLGMIRNYMEGQYYNTDFTEIKWSQIQVQCNFDFLSAREL